MVSFSSKPIKDNFLISSKLNVSPFLNSKFSMALLEFVTLASTTDFKITLSFGELLKDIFMSVKFEVVFISPFEFTLWTIKSSLFIPSPNLIVSLPFVSVMVSTPSPRL